MPLKGELEAAVDQILDAVWPKERRRALVHLATSTLGRIAAFLAALVLFGFVVHLLFGLNLPWTFVVFMTVLTLVCARPETAHLRRGVDAKPPHRPSTGCYPGNGVLT